MSSFDKSKFLQQLQQLCFSQEHTQTWNSLEQGIRGLALEAREEKDAEADAPSATQLWWQQCFELLAPRQVSIQHVQFDGEEYIELYNCGPAIVDISGWRINAGDQGQDMTFADETLLAPHASVRVYTAPGHPYTFDSKVPIWNNKGDTGYLYHVDGTLLSSWAYGSDAHQGVAISNIHYDGEEKYTEGDEYAEIVNLSEHKIDLSAWCLSAGNQQDFHFPTESVLTPGGKIRVYTNKEDPSTGGYSFRSNKAVWNNKGDTGRLSDHRSTVVHEYRYGTF